MPSSLTWLDHDNIARERSYQLLQLFMDSETRDVLGIGAIRDSISNQMVPGSCYLGNPDAIALHAAGALAVHADGGGLDPGGEIP